MKVSLVVRIAMLRALDILYEIDHALNGAQTDQMSADCGDGTYISTHLACLVLHLVKDDVIGVRLRLHPNGE